MSQDGANRERPLIAVVNHESVFINLMKKILALDGYDTMACQASETFHDDIREQQPDLIILDTWLETRDQGWALLQNLWLDEETSHLPVLICSSDDRDRFEARLDQLDGKKVGVLHKPFDPEMLLATVRRMLEGDFTMTRLSPK